jgi:hypothetical protein
VSSIQSWAGNSRKKDANHDACDIELDNGAGCRVPVVAGRLWFFLPECGERQGDALAAGAADELGLVTFIPDDLDWEDEVRIAVEERTSFSPDALTGMEASLRFPGPETLETKIFGRLSAWQNWIFQRPNAVGEEGALQLYGTGRRAKYNPQRV